MFLYDGRKRMNTEMQDDREEVEEAEDSRKSVFSGGGFFLIWGPVFILISFLYLVFMNNVNPQSIPQWLADFPQHVAIIYICSVGMIIVISISASKDEWGRKRLKTFYFELVIPLILLIGIIPLIAIKWGIVGMKVYLIVLASLIGVGMCRLLLYLVLNLRRRAQEDDDTEQGEIAHGQTRNTNPSGG